MPKYDVKQHRGITRLFHAKDKDDKVTLYFLASDERSLWVSLNGGEKYLFREGDVPSNIKMLYVNPMYPGQVIAERFTTNNDKKEIYLGQEFGQTWSKLESDLPTNSKVAWSVSPSTNPNRIYLSRPIKPDSSELVLVYSDNFFKNFTVLSPRRVDTWATFEPNNIVVTTCDAHCTSRQLYISNDAGMTFNQAIIPERKETSYEANFHVWEISDDAIWTYVDRSCTNDGACWGDLYHSNSADKDFVLSLPYNKKWEFTKYNSVDGIYLANQLVTTQGIPVSGNLVRSLITFNKGSEWNVLTAPEFDANGQPTNCHVKDGCSLHVHGYTSSHSFTYFYSIPNAVGLMVASGNWGKRLEEREDLTNTYVSFNGGVKWQEVRKNDYVPEIGDHGSIVVMVKEDGLTDEVVYTINDGTDWPTCKFTDVAFDVSNIRVSLNWDSKRFILYGQRQINGTTKAVVVQLNFDEEFTGPCTENDFETWSPTSEHSHCVMGQSTNYNKRIKGRNCYLGEDYKVISSSKPCPCVDEDYECDHCFSRQDLSSPCSLFCPVPGLPSPPENCNSTQSYQVDKGYRLVDNDKCDIKLSGSEKPKGVVPCGQSNTNYPPNDSSITNKPNTAGIVVLIIIFVLIFSAIGIVYYLYKNNDSFYNFVSYTFGIEDNSRNPIRYENVEQAQSLASHVDNDDD
eukprot:TRINITY_DN16016_c0_g1_i1.p1 TRINITY_DN16016_c0_g1~~TRINITY_DN16016_c0_g1_i1.p1  ORF type:complete len:710 (-),score=133.91 TRINITY_DN16016_c0_g1_i1:27-2072(-)